MFFSLKTDCYYRHYGNIGYLTRPIISLEEVVDEIGAIFLDKLSYELKDVDEIVSEIISDFDAPCEELKHDAIYFYSKLAEDGFLNVSEDNILKDNGGFDYSTLDGKISNNNIQPQLEESSSSFLSKFFNDNPFLDTFHIEITSRCNERCIHCYIPHETKNKSIEPKLYYSVIDQCKEMGVMTIIISGGEPTLHPNFCEFVKYAKDLDFNVVILSNMTLLSDEILNVLKYRHASCVNISLYSMDPEVHDSITTLKGSFDKTFANINKLIENNIPVQINLPVMKQNKDTFHEVIKWGQEMKCMVNTDYLIMARSDRTTDNLENRLTYDELQDVIKIIIENNIAIRHRMEQGADEKASEENNPEDRVCGVGRSTLCMVSSGKVYPCAGWQKQICGDLNLNSLKDIWTNSPQIIALRSIKLKDFKKCANCDDVNYCLMCMSRNSNENPEGSLFVIPPITCEAARINHQIVAEYYKKNSANND